MTFIMPPRERILSRSRQEFLKTVYLLQVGCERVPATLLARALAISANSVSNMIACLSSIGLLDYRKRQGVRLTQPGDQTARMILRRHELIEQYLVEKLDYGL